MAVSKRKPRAKCPICGRPSLAAHVPFCSTRCADLDLSRWLGGGYRIPTDDRDADVEPADPEPEE